MKKTKTVYALALILLLVLTGCTGSFASDDSIRKTSEQDNKKLPSLAVTEPVPGFETDQTQLEIKGKTDMGSSIKLDGVKLNVQPDGSFNVKVELVTGMNMFTVTAISKDGASRDKEVSVNCTAKRVIEISPPVMHDASPRDISTPSKALIGHWLLDETKTGGDKSHWYFNGSEMSIYIEGEDVLLSAIEYTVVKEDMDAFTAVLQFTEIDQPTISFSSDCKTVRFSYSDATSPDESGQLPTQLTYVDMKESL
jgi:ribosomal protein L11